MKVRNTHIGVVAGIKPRAIGEATPEEVARWPWALVPVEPAPEAVREVTPAPAPPRRGPGRPPKAAAPPPADPVD